jgi:hypothetical protein
VTIAYQPVTTQQEIPARPPLPRRPHGLVPVDLPSRASTATRIVGLVAATSMCMALVIAFVAGMALLALVNFAG